VVMIIDVSITIDASIINTMVIIGTPQRPSAAEVETIRRGRRRSVSRWFSPNTDRQ
jgi:hypothetical protein